MGREEADPTYQEESWMEWSKSRKKSRVWQEEECVEA